MKPARTFALFLLVLGLGGYIYFVDQHRASSPEREEELRRAFRIDPARTTRLAIRRPEYELELLLENREWVLASPRGARAHEAMIWQTLSRLRSLSRGELITPADMRERGQTLADFGLAVPTLVLTLEDARGTREYRIGNPNPLGNALYVKEEQSQNVMLVSTDLLDILPADPSLFRDRNLLPFPPGDVRGVTLRAGETVLRAEQVDGQWMITEPYRFPANPDAVAQFLERLSLARIESFLGVVDEADALYGLEENAVIIRIHPLGAGEVVEIQVGAMVEGAPGLRYARFAGRRGVFIVSEGVWLLARTEHMALRDLRVLPVDPSLVNAFSLSSPEGLKILLARQGGDWRLMQPAERPASRERAQRVLELWSTARVESMLPLEEGAPFKYRIRFDGDQIPSNLPREFSVWESSEPGRVWVRPEGSDLAWLVVPDILSHLPMAPLAYFSRILLQFDPSAVVRVNVTRNQNVNTFIRTGPAGAWTSENTVPDPITLHTLLSYASRLRVDELMEEIPPVFTAEEPPPGLVRISFGLSGADAANRTLLLYPEEDGLWIAWILGQDIAFRLSAEAAEILTSPLSRPLPPESEAHEPAPLPTDV